MNGNDEHSQVIWTRSWCCRWWCGSRAPARNRLIFRTEMNLTSCKSSIVAAGGPGHIVRVASGAGQRYRLQSGCHLGINVFLSLQVDPGKAFAVQVVLGKGIDCSPVAILASMCFCTLAGGPGQSVCGAGGAGQRYRLQSGTDLGINVFFYPCRWTRTKRLRCRWCWRRASSTLASATCSVRCCTPTPAASAASGAACPLSPVTNPDVSAAEL